MEMVLVDLPGLGNSTGEAELAGMSSQAEIEALYLRFLAEVHEHCFGERQPCLVGHSFGGFWATMFAHRHPDKIHSLVLEAPAGLLPTHSSTGAFWAIFFRWVVTCEPLQFAGSCGWWVATRLAQLVTAE